MSVALGIQHDKRTRLVVFSNFSTRNRW